MTGLNRDFLMPYLQNVCSLHLVLRKNEQKMRRINYLIFEAEDGPTVEPPQPRENVSEKNSVYYALYALGCVVTAFCLMFVALNIAQGTRIGLSWAVAGIAAGVLVLVLTRVLVRYRRNVNQRIDAENTRAYEQYRHAAQEAEEQTANTLARLKQRMQELVDQNKHVDTLLQTAYAVDLIPEANRNIYCAVYLYEWICSSRSVDLNLALESFDLESYQTKLEHIVINQTNAILVHTKTASSHYRTLTMQNQQEGILRAKAAQLACTPKQLEIYNAIVDLNVEAGAFFATAENLI